MANEKTTKTTTTKEWGANEKQKAFMEELKNYPDGATLKDIEIDTGKVFATGTINVLVTKKLVVAEEADGVEVDLVYRGVKIGTTTKNWKKYKLA